MEQITPLLSSTAGGRIEGSLLSLEEFNAKFIQSNSIKMSVVIFLYFLAGVLVYHFWQGWNITDSIYFMVTTLLTIGYGEIVPTSDSTRLFTAIYILFGICICGFVLSSLATFTIENHEKLKRLRNRRALNAMKIFHLKESGDIESSNNCVQFGNEEDGTKDEYKRLCLEVGDDVHNEQNNKPANDKSKSWRSFVGRLTRGMSSSMSPKTYDQIRLCILRIAASLAVLLVGMMVICSMEGWSYIAGFYWATATLVTVGFGDFQPTTIAAQWFTIFYALIGCTFLTLALTEFVRYPIVARVLKDEIKVMSQFSGQLSSEKLNQLFNNDLFSRMPDLKRTEKEISKCEFILLVLTLMDKVEERDIFLVGKLFENWDTNLDGVLNLGDIKQIFSDAQRREVENGSDLTSAVASGGDEVKADDWLPSFF
eukprot:gene24435-32884_t